MSHSPVESVAADEARDYLDAFRRLNRLIHQGRPFSGHETGCAFVNTGTGRFATASSAVGFDFADDGRAIAVVDWDHDGDLDVWAVNRTAPVVRFLRNDGAGDAVGLGLRPVGDRANRDAVGTRVRVRLEGDPRAPLSRTVRAGEGYLSDGGRWLHFGLGASPEIAEVSVRWPDGSSERFEGVAPGGRFVLEKGTGRARPAPVRRSPAVLETAPLPTAPTGIRTRAPLRALAPLPATPYRTIEGDAREIAGPGAAGPTLVNLWASWCAPCVRELGSFARDGERWREAGLRIVALSVDGLDPEHDTGPPDAARVLAELAFPFDAGIADTATLEVLATWQRAVYGRERPFPVPTSVLLDADGVPAVLYKGAIDPDTLAADVGALVADPVSFRRDALPEPGTWIDEPPPSLAGAVVLALDEDGLDEAARRYLDDLDALAFRRPAVTFDPALVAGRIRVADGALRNGRPVEAEAGFLVAVRDAPDNATALDGLGRALGAQGRHAEAEPVLRRAVEADPRRADSRHDLGVALAAQGRAADAIPWFREAARLAPERADFRRQLGNALMDAGRPAEAAAAFEAAAGLDPADADVRVRLGSARAAVGDADGAIRALVEARDLAPSEVTPRVVLALVLESSGRAAEAAGEYREALALAPDATVATRLAWILATSPDADVRDGVEAERIARAACEASGWGDPAALDALAAALAETGRYDQAAEAARRGARAARASGHEDLARAIEARGRGYAGGRPHREGR